MIKHTLLSITNVNYTSRNGEKVDQTILHYFNSTELIQERDEKGYRVLNKDVQGDYTEEDFKEIPGIYEMRTRARTARGRAKAKPEGKIVSINLLGKLDIPQEGENYLILWGKEYDYDSKDGDNYKGIKLIGIDPMEKESGDIIGYPPIEFSMPNSKLSDNLRLPGYYSLDYSEVRGRNGNTLLEITKINLVKPYDFPNVPTTRTPSPPPNNG